jgi:hypothetical protein
MSRTTTTTRVSRIFGLAALAGLTLASIANPLPSQAAKPFPRVVRPVLVSTTEYVIVAVNPGTPNTLQVRDPLTGALPITVTLSPTANIVRRYNGKSSFGELEVSDRVTLWPAKATSVLTPTAIAPVTSTTVLVTRVKDFSIQVAYTQIAGKITAISADKTQIGLQVTATKGHNVAAFQVGQNITLDVSATTPVFLGKKTGTVADLQVGMILRTWGLSDGATGVMPAPHALHVVPLKSASQTDATTTTSDS